ncbi:MAG: hypothetical protein ACTHNT_15230 [Actinomycetales bacterium]
MPLTESEFRSLLAEQAAEPGPPVDRVASVRRRIARRRQRRQMFAGAAIAALLVGGAGLTLPHLAARQTDQIATPAPTSAPLLAQYANGGRLLGSAILQSPRQGQVSASFTPTDWHLQVQLDCAKGWPSDTWSVVSVNGHALMGGGGGCASGITAPFGGDEEFWSPLGVRLGQPSTVTLTLTPPTPDLTQQLCRTCSPLPPAPSRLPLAQRPAGRLAVGVYQQVPVGEYPLPPRPATVLPLSRVAGPGTLDSRVVGATGTFTLTAKVGPRMKIMATAVAPGALRYLINGTPINENDYWRWDTTTGGSTLLDQDTLQRAGLHIPDGTTAELTVEASRFTVPGWTVRLYPGP